MDEVAAITMIHPGNDKTVGKGISDVDSRLTYLATTPPAFWLVSIS
jgi:hypothetical protein